MRARLFVISSLAVVAVLGAANAAQAKPNGPGDIKYQPQPTTTTTQPPKGPDKVAPKPTTTTTTPPKGPGDLANPQSDPVVDPAPTGNGSGSDLDYPTTMGDDEGNLVHAGEDGNGAVEHEDSQVADTNTATSPAEANGSSNLPTIVIVLLAGVVGALIALVAARLRRDDDEHAPQV